MDKKHPIKKIIKAYKSINEESGSVKTVKTESAAESMASVIRKVKRAIPGHNEKTGKLIQSAYIDQRRANSFTAKHGDSHQIAHGSHASSHFHTALVLHDRGDHEGAHRQAVKAIQHSYHTNAWDDEAHHHNELSKHIGMGDHNSNHPRHIEKQNKRVMAAMDTASKRMEEE